MELQEKFIPLQELKKGKEAYKKVSTVETESVWVSIQDLEAYIDKVKKESSDNNIPLSGIRMHFVIEGEAEDMLNVAFTPTFETSGAHVAFEPLFSEEGKPLSLNNMEENFEMLQMKTTSIFNKHVPCPPKCIR